jgi:hypothetical protein
MYLGPPAEVPAAGHFSSDGAQGLGVALQSGAGHWTEQSNAPVADTLTEQVQPGRQVGQILPIELQVHSTPD